MQRLSGLAVILALACACTSDEGGEDYDDGCWYTCTPGAPTCSDGVVTHYASLHMSCEEFYRDYGECPIVTHTCTDGCIEEGARFDLVDNRPYLNAAALCAETAPAHLGDSCSMDVDLACSPPPILMGEYDLVAYLWCQNGECAARGWLDAPASSESQELCGTSATGFAGSEICPAEYFYYQDDRGRDCVWSACTIPCVTSAECPDGVACDLSVADTTGGFGLCTPDLTDPAAYCAPC